MCLVRPSSAPASEFVCICRMCVKCDTHIEQEAATEHRSLKSTIFLKNTFRRLISIGTYITLKCALPPYYRSCTKSDQKSFQFSPKYGIVDSITCFILLNRIRFFINSNYYPQRKIRKVTWPYNTNNSISGSTSYMLLAQEKVLGYSNHKMLQQPGSDLSHIPGNQGTSTKEPLWFEGSRHQIWCPVQDLI